MAQQINLYSPILLAPRRYFSALAMAQALGALVLGLAALSWWADASTRRLRSETEAAAAAQQRDRQQLEAALAARPATGRDAAALEQELAQARRALAERRQVLDEFSPAAGHAAQLRALAQGLPDAVWLTEVRIADGRLDIAGMALQPDALRPWLDRLVASPLWAGLALRTVKVERSDAPGSEAWAFRVVGSRAALDKAGAS